jgi:hypothetical protein
MISATSASPATPAAGGWRISSPGRDRGVLLGAIEFAGDSAILSSLSAPSPWSLSAWPTVSISPRPFDLGTAIFAQGLTRSGLDRLWGRLYDRPLDDEGLTAWLPYGQGAQTPRSLMSRLIDVLA